MPEDLLTVEHLSVVYSARPAGQRIPWRREDHPVLKDITLRVAHGAAYGVVGESGAGKTTLLRTIAGLQAPTSGTLRFGGELLSANRSQAQRRALQVIFQDPRSSLNPRMTVGQMLGELLRVHKIVSRASVAAECERLLSAVGLPAGALAKRPHAFSGGQRQRVGIARALALRPRLLLADEPVSALDVSIQADILQLLKRLQQELNLTVLFISHDLAVVRQFSDQVAVLADGEIVEQGPADVVFSAPVSPYTRELVAAAPHLPVHRIGPDGQGAPSSRRRMNSEP